MATRVSKEVFIATKNREIEMYNAFIKACDILIEHAPKWDGKCLNVRYTKAMDEEINKVVEKYRDWNENTQNSITFGFDKDYNGNREMRFRMIYQNRYIKEVNNYLSYNESTIYQPYQGEQYITEDNRLNSEAYVKRLKEMQSEYRYRIESGREAIKNIEKTIRIYEELNKTIKDTMASLPEEFRQHVSCQCPIY